jgi:hypothetical protein
VVEVEAEVEVVEVVVQVISNLGLQTVFSI